MKAKKKPVTLSRHIRYDRKGWIKTLTLRPQEAGGLEAMEALLLDTIKELSLEVAKVEEVRRA